MAVKNTTIGEGATAKEQLNIGLGSSEYREFVMDKAGISEKDQDEKYVEKDMLLRRSSFKDAKKKQVEVDDKASKKVAPKIAETIDTIPYPAKTNILNQVAKLAIAKDLQKRAKRITKENKKLAKSMDKEVRRQVDKEDLRFNKKDIEHINDIIKGGRLDKGYLLEKTTNEFSIK